MSSIIVQPQTANIMNAVLCGLMSFGLLMTPKQFMNGGVYQKPWFNNLPEESDNKLYYIGQFMGFLMLGGGVIPALLSPDSQFLCYQMTVVHFVNFLHALIFMFSDYYKDAKPNTKTGKYQWYFMNFIGLVFGIVTLLASLHSTTNVIDTKETYISKKIANIIMLAFSSTFGVLFSLFPQHLISMFWHDDNNQNPKKFLKFDIINLSDIEKWWTRCIGSTILALNSGMLIDLNINQPLYTAGSMVIVGTLTLFNLFQVTMRPYKSITDRHIRLSWIPNLLSSGVMAGILASALLYI